MKKTFGVATIAAAIALGGCETMEENQKATAGAAIGAVTGAIIGHQVSHGSGAYVGAALGALAGGSIGYYMDKQERELEQQLQAEREAHAIEIQRMQASLRSRERFWDIRVPKIDSIFDNSLVPRPSWSPGVPPQHRKLVAATHRSPI